MMCAWMESAKYTTIYKGDISDINWCGISPDICYIGMFWYWLQNKLLYKKCDTIFSAYARDKATPAQIQQCAKSIYRRGREDQQYDNNCKLHWRNTMYRWMIYMWKMFEQIQRTYPFEDKSYHSYTKLYTTINLIHTYIIYYILYINLSLFFGSRDHIQENTLILLRIRSSAGHL